MATTVKCRIGGCGRVSGDTDDDNSLVTSGSLSSDWGEYGKTCVWMDTDWESGVSADDGRMSE